MGLAEKAAKLKRLYGTLAWQPGWLRLLQAVLRIRGAQG
jgi:hypothetical protein